MKTVYVVDYAVRDALGSNAQDNYAKMSEAVGPQLINRYDTTKFSNVLTTNGYQTNYPNSDNIGYKMIMDCTEELSSKYSFDKNTAVVVGSFALGLAVRDGFNDAFVSGQRRFSPTKLFMANHDLINAIVAGKLKLEGISTSLNAACSSSMFNLYFAYNLIRSGSVSEAIVGAVDAPHHPGMNYHWQCTSAISTQNGGICKPFDKSRDGFLQGEGATLWYICDEDTLKRKNLTPRAVIRGITAGAKMATMTAHDKTCEHQILMINQTLLEAGLSTKDISFFNAHATSTLVGDDIEVDVFQKVFHNEDIPIVSFKGHIGHTMSASGLIESAYGLEAARSTVLKPNFGLDDPLTDDPRLIVNSTALRSKIFLKASFGFGGRTSIAIFESL